MKGPSVQQRSVTIPRQAGFSSLLSEMIRLVVGVGTLLWFHALAAVFKEVININLDARARV
jgi:hypothetical protein